MGARCSLRPVFKAAIRLILIFISIIIMCTNVKESPKFARIQDLRKVIVTSCITFAVSVKKADCTMIDQLLLTRTLQ
jgi:hypothetical protein